MLKKAPAQSTLRYCQRATELPYSELVEYPEFTVAISRISQARDTKALGAHGAPQAIGMLDGATTYPDGSEQPLLPVRITFEPDLQPPVARLGSGWMDKHYGAEETFFVLELTVDDPDQHLFKIIDHAMERAALSGNRFLHLHCRKAKAFRGRSDNLTSSSLDRITSILKAVEADEARFPAIYFDEILFRDDLILNSEPWAWAWPEFESGGPRYRSKGVEKWRTDRARWFK